MSTPRPELRVGDRDRDLVASALREALAEGRITADELDVRLDGALRARTFADLDRLVSDLPIEPPSSALTPSRPAADVRSPPLPGASPQDRLILDAGWSSVKRQGRWYIPPFLLVDGAIGSVKLNCLRATPGAEVIDVQVVASLGTVTIVVPDTWAVNRDRLTSSWGVARIKVSATPAPDAPLLLLHGSVGWGWLTVRYANWLDDYRLRRFAELPPQRRPELGR